MSKRKFSMMLAAAMVMVLFTGLGMASAAGADLDMNAPEPTIRIVSTNAKPGDVINIPISITEPNGLAGYGFAIQYDSKVLTPAQNVQAGTASGVGAPVYNPAYSSNKIFLTWADANAIDSNGSLAVVSFTVKSGAKSGSTLLAWDKANIFVNDSDGTDVTSTFAFSDGTIDITGGSSPGGGGGSSVVSVTVTGVSVKNAPQKVIYNEGDALDLTGLTVTLEYVGGGTEDVALDKFDDYKITVSPAKGTILKTNDTQLIIKVNGKTAVQNITVNKPAPAEPPVKPPVIKLTDIDGHWAEGNIERLVEKGCIAGYADGTFQPDETITRAEFTTLIVKAFDLQADREKVFNDTANHWAKEYISAAAGGGTVQGYNSLVFSPDEMITREQMAIMIVNAAAAKPKAGELPYRDKTDISPWALSWVTTAVHNDLMSGYPDNTFRPQANATRAEAVTVIINALRAGLS